MDWTPRPFQTEDADAAVHTFGGRALLAHEMGLGKTLITYMAVKQMRPWPVIICCPAYLKRNWYGEGFSKFGYKPYILSGQSIYDREGIKKAKIVIVNYEILPYWLPFLISLKAKLVVADECQMIANVNTVAARSFRWLCKHSTWTVPHVFGLSGTPLVNRPWELYSIISILWPEEFDSPFAFGMTYCSDGGNAYGKWRFSGAKNLKGLHERLKRCGMIRRTKQEVLKDLPPMQRYVVPMEIDNRDEYDEAQGNLIRWLSSFDLVRANSAQRAKAWAQMSYQKRLAARGKVPAVIGWIESFLRETEGKLLVGAVHRVEEPIIPRLLEPFTDCAVTIHGGRSQKQRQEAEDRFQNDPGTRLLIGQVKACGLGLNLTAASAVVTCELAWTPGTHQQFDKRIDRIGQKEPTAAYYLIAEDTIETKLCQIIQRKQEILDKVLDGVEVREDSLTIFSQLQQAMLSKKGRSIT